MKLAILDRIGTLNLEGEESIVALQDWVPQPGVLAAIAQLNRGGWQVSLATNQPGLGRGSFDVNELNAIHTRVQRELAAAGARMEALFFCPHTQEDACQCRKPAPGLLQQVAARYGVQPHEVWVIGQERSHIEAGEAMGAHLAVIDSPPGSDWVDALGSAVAVYPDWQAVADALAPDLQAQQPPAAPDAALAL